MHRFRFGRTGKTNWLSIGAEGWYYAVVMVLVLAGALLREINLLLLLAGLMAGPLLLSALLALFALRKIEIVRTLPNEVRAGDEAEVSLTISNRRRRWSAWALRIDDRISHAGITPARAESRGVSLLLQRVRPGEQQSATYLGRFALRGRYRFGPLACSSAFPLGLIRRQRKDWRTQELIVYPRLGRLGPLWRAWQEQRAATGAKSDFRRGLVEGDFHGLREWRSGDNRRWIHWRTSARRGALVVRQFEQHRSDDVHVLVDLWQPPRATAAQREAVELAVSLAATIVTDVCRRRGKRLRVSLAGSEFWHRSGQPSAALLVEASEALAVTAPHHLPHLPQPLAQRLRRSASAAQTVVISTRSAVALRGGQDDHDPASAGNSSGAKWIDVTGPDLGEYFELPDSEPFPTLSATSTIPHLSIT